MKKKVVKLCIIVLMLIPIIKVHGNELTDKYTCTINGYSPVKDGENNEVVCCPSGFDYGANYNVTLDDDEKVCYKKISKNNANQCDEEKYDSVIRGNDLYCYTDPSNSIEETVGGNNGSGMCYVCKGYEKYAFSTSKPQNGCLSEWTVLDISDNVCKSKAEAINNKNSIDGIYMSLLCKNGYDNDGKPQYIIPQLLTDNSGQLVRSILSLNSIETNGDYKMCPVCWLNDKYNLNSKCSDNSNRYKEENKEIFNYGICPMTYRDTKTWDFTKDFTSTIVPYGRQIPEKEGLLSDDKFIIYSYEYDGKTKIIVEAYTIEKNIKGKYGYVGGDLTVTIIDEIIAYQRNTLNAMYTRDGEIDFFNIDHKYKTLQISGNGTDDKDIGVCEGKSKIKCTEDYGFKVLLVSGDGEKVANNGMLLDNNNNGYIDDDEKGRTIDRKVEEYMNSPEGAGLQKIEDTIQGQEDPNILEKAKFINTCKKFNEEMNKTGTYNFDDYPLDNMINDLTRASKMIDELYEVSDNIFGGKTLTTAAMEWIMNDAIGSTELLDAKFKRNDESSLNAEEKDGEENVVYTSFKRLVDKKLTSMEQVNKYGLNLLALQDDLEYYGGMFYESVNNLLSGQINLTISQENKLNDIYDTLDQIAEEKDWTYGIVNCQGLLSQKLIDKINSYLDIVKYAVPILLIGFGIFDFAKALFSSEEETMKKSQQTFIKRLAIAIIFFFVPIIVNLILSLANKVWPIIIPNSCEAQLKDK